MDKKEIKKFVIKSARLIDDKKGDEIKVYDLKGLSSLCDYVIIATATSAPHLQAIEEEVSTKLKEFSLYKTNRDGAQSGNWRVSDYGGFMLHLMTEEARAFYALDKVFSFAKELAWQEKQEQKPVKKAKTAAKKTTKKAAIKITKKNVKKTAKKVAKKTTKKTTKNTAAKSTKKTIKKATKKVAKKITKKGTK